MPKGAGQNCAPPVQNSASVAAVSVTLQGSGKLYTCVILCDSAHTWLC